MKEVSKVLKILSAYKAGKIIELFQVEDNSGVWVPLENVDLEDLAHRPDCYRVKPKPKPEPFLNAYEFTKALKEHGDYIYCEPYVAALYMPLAIDNYNVVLYGFEGKSGKFSYQDLAKKWCFSDGTKCCKN